MIRLFILSSLFSNVTLVVHPRNLDTRQEVLGISISSNTPDRRKNHVSLSTISIGTRYFSDAPCQDLRSLNRSFDHAVRVRHRKEHLAAFDAERPQIYFEVMLVGEAQCNLGNFLMGV